MRRTLRIIALAALLLIAFAAEAQAEAVLWVVAEHAPLRSARSGQAEVLAELPRGEAVRLLESRGAWARVRETAGREGWIYQGHLSSSPPPPVLASLFDPLPQTLVLAEAADTSRSSRSQAPMRPEGSDALWAVLDLRLTPEMLEEFLKTGGIGEYAGAFPQGQGSALTLAPPKPAAATGGEAERQVGLNLAAAVVRRMAKPAFGMAQQRYVNLVGLTVARYAPGPTPRLRVVVLDLRVPAAFSLPGGVVMLSTGLLSVLENEAQLALILAHETAHASLGHVWARALESQFFRYGGRVDADGVRSHLFSAMLEDLLVYTLSQGIDPKLEYDADAAAVQMAYRAGYDPQQYPRALRLIEQAGLAGQANQTEAETGPPSPWSALHPPLAQRLAHIQALLARLPQAGLALATERYRANR